MKVALFDAYRASLIDVFVELISLCLFAHTHTQSTRSPLFIQVSPVCVFASFSARLYVFFTFRSSSMYPTVWSSSCSQLINDA
jgi:hypothetical protein